MDMSQAVRGLVNLFINMDGSSRVMFIRLLVTKMEDEEVDMVLQVIDLRQKGGNFDSADVSKLLDIKLKQEPEDYGSDSNFDPINDQDSEDREIKIEGESFPKTE